MSDITSNNLASASKIIIIDSETLDTPAYMEMTQEVIMAREEDVRYNGRESNHDYVRLNQATYNIQHIVSDTILM